jgi:cyclopropane fatty-acyl-phospholipid synthase-like methyltransferase
MADDPKQIVADANHEVAPRYLAGSLITPEPARHEYLARLLDMLPPGAGVLELGCGAGVPVTQALARIGRVVGVDISSEQIALAERHVPDATFILSDMADLDFEAESFGAVVSFYALTHVPRGEHAELLGRIAGWLRPGGLLFATMGAGDAPDIVEPDWLGAPMFFSHYDADANRDMVRRAGLDILFADVAAEDEDGQTVEFLWIAARKPEDRD